MKKIVWFTVIIGLSVVYVRLRHNHKNFINQVRDDELKQQEFYQTLCQWVMLHQQKKSIAEFLLKQNYRSVAIYGMKELGMLLVDELKDSDIEVYYAIDRNADKIRVDIPVVGLDEEFEPVDVIVVTAIHQYEEIEVEIRDRINCPILSLEDILFEV